LRTLGPKRRRKWRREQERFGRRLTAAPSQIKFQQAISYKMNPNVKKKKENNLFLLKLNWRR